MKRRTNEEWLSDLQSSDPDQRNQAWQDLYGTLFRYTVRPYLSQRCHGIRQMAEDLQGYAEQVTQEAILKIYEALILQGRYRRERGSFLTWAITVTRNTAADTLRREIRRIGLSLDEVIETALATSHSPPASHDAASRLDCQEFVRRVLRDDLSKAQREACILKYYYDYRIREISEMMMKSEKAVENLLHEARKKFRQRAAKERFQW